MSASEASLYKAVGSFDLSGQTSPLTVSNPKIELDSDVLVFLKTERGTVSGVSIQNIQQGSFQAVFNTANDSIYSYLAVPPVYKFYADENPINPVNPTQRTQVFIGNPNTIPLALFSGQSYIWGSFSIEAGRTCTSGIVKGSLLYDANLGSGGTIGIRTYEGATLIETFSVSVPSGTTDFTYYTIDSNLTPSLYSSTISPRTFRFEIFNNSAGFSTFLTLYDITLDSPNPHASSATITANYV